MTDNNTANNTAQDERIILCTATLQEDPMQCSEQNFLAGLDAAAEAEFAGISLWQLHWMLVLGGGLTEQKAKDAVAERGLSVGMVEAIMPWSAPDDAKAIEGAVGAFELAASFGAENVLAVCLGDEMESVKAGAARYKEVCRAAQDFGVNVPIEFLPWGAIPSIETAWQIVETADQENGGILIDTWHWQRQPGGPDHERLRQIPGEFIRAVQLCDAAPEAEGDPMTECMTARLLPGEGAVDFPPLLADLAAIGADPLWAPEVFSNKLTAKGPQPMAEAMREATLAVLQ